ncbi:hypothetical protein BCR33DRAFT_721835 [Rhizoclosmatium globosum]|uniref:Pinin/SDK/MemA protein domain-containing protein n=1 Tax=Rhizoclosmatium globosum TaxID=329046 RepID=A0A1Y2BQ93_9FUNG|nr:hypothetical protein BCR33DRAFT_721835 [Rhizoclosmatium globosum]|eukprot:ORY36921.1 hypothetical protein BCR33DRAFT_721835 [Rhizoclosmatium globosum]
MASPDIKAPTSTTSSAPPDDLDRPTSSTNERKRPRSGANDEATSRGKRMFGAIFGTLSKAQIQPKTESELKREETEKRLREKLAAEKASLAAEIEAEREKKAKEKEERLKGEQEKRDAEKADTIRRQKENVAHFIKLGGEPGIYFKPGKHNARTQKVVDEQLKALEAEQGVSSENDKVMQIDKSEDKVEEKDEKEKDLVETQDVIMGEGETGTNETFAS